MTGDEARELVGVIGAMFPNQPMSEESARLYVARLQQFAPRDRDAIVTAIERKSGSYLPSLPDLVSIATAVTVERIREERVSRDHQVIEAFKLESGMTDEQADANVQRMKAMTRDYLQRVNAAKAANKGILPDDWERTEPQTETTDPTRCPACKGSDPGCKTCDGRGLVCPTCHGSHILTRGRKSSERPLYIGCPDCTDWERQTLHTWDAHGWPKFQRDHDREVATIHAARSRRRAA